MAEEHQLLADATARMIAQKLPEDAQAQAEQGVWLEALWQDFAEMQLPLLLASEEAGGFGMTAADAMPTLRLLGSHAVPLPLVDTMVANKILGQAQLPLAEGPAALIPAGQLQAVKSATGYHISGQAPRVAWGRHVRALVADIDGQIFHLRTGWRCVEEGRNLAGHARDTLDVDAQVTADHVAALPQGLDILGHGGAARAILAVGAMQSALELTVAHTSTRIAFGKSLSKQQAVQQDIARVAMALAATSACADMAADALDDQQAHRATLRLAAARTRISEASQLVHGISHQLHGAIGFTREYRLHLFTRPLLAWRDEFGSYRHWALVLGDAALAAGGDGYWPMITAA